MGVALFLVFVYLFGFVQLGTQGAVTRACDLHGLLRRDNRARPPVRGREVRGGGHGPRGVAVAGDKDGAAADADPGHLGQPHDRLRHLHRRLRDNRVLDGRPVLGHHPVKLYSAARAAPSPALNALASILLFASMLAIGIAILVMRRPARRRARKAPRSKISPGWSSESGRFANRPAGNTRRISSSPARTPRGMLPSSRLAPLWCRCAARAGLRAAGTRKQAIPGRRTTPPRRWPACTGSGLRGRG